jgi:hypothetical protein
MSDRPKLRSITGGVKLELPAIDIPTDAEGGLADLTQPGKKPAVNGAVLIH